LSKSIVLALGIESFVIIIGCMMLAGENNW
jgi:hypothetical protein